MKLEKFKEKNHKKKIAIGICIVLVLLVAGIIVYRSFAFYEEKKAFDVIKGQVPDQNYDLMFSFYVKDENENMIYQETMPTENGHNYEVTVSCDNGATGEWDYEAWGPNIQNVTTSRTKCKLIFVKSDTVVPSKNELSFTFSFGFGRSGSNSSGQVIIPNTGYKTLSIGGFWVEGTRPTLGYFRILFDDEIILNASSALTSGITYDISNVKKINIFGFCTQNSDWGSYFTNVKLR